MSAPSPNDERFCRQESAGTPLREAVEQLCQDCGSNLESMEQLTMGEICSLAQDTYRAELPLFWQTWIDWNEPGRQQPMGDL